MNIWRATPADIDEIRACVDAAYRHYIPRIGGPPGPMLADYAAAVRDHQVWVAGLDGRIIGLLVLIPQDSYILLDNIAVRPDAQGQGIGRRLLGLADREAARQSFSELRLYTHQLMTENIDFYHRLGWEETGRGHQDGFPRVFFRKRVSSTPAGQEDAPE